MEKVAREIEEHFHKKGMKGESGGGQIASKDIEINDLESQIINLQSQLVGFTPLSSTVIREPSIVEAVNWGAGTLPRAYRCPRRLQLYVR